MIEMVEANRTQTSKNMNPLSECGVNCTITSWK